MSKKIIQKRTPVAENKQQVYKNICRVQQSVFPSRSSQKLFSFRLSNDGLFIDGKLAKKKEEKK